MSTVYGAIRNDKSVAMSAGHMKSVRSASILENGFVFFANALASGHREVFEVIQPTTALIASDVLLIHSSVPTTYLAGETIVNFKLDAGHVGRAYVLHPGDVYTITDSMITASVNAENFPVVWAVGDYLSAENGSFKLKVSSVMPTGARMVARVIERTMIYGLAATAFEVIQA